MVILAVILTTAYRVFSSSYSALNHLSPDRDLFHTARVILDRMADEIQSAYYKSDLKYTGFFGENRENGDAPRDSLTFSAMANFYWIGRTEGIMESDFLKVSYYLGEKEDGGEERWLLRRQDPAFDRFEEDPEMIGSDDRGVHRLADEVWGIDIRYYDGTEWLEEWNSADQEKLPQAVEIKLILETDGGKPLPFYAIIPIEAS